MKGDERMKFKVYATGRMANKPENFFIEMDGITYCVSQETYLLALMILEIIRKEI